MIQVKELLIYRAKESDLKFWWSTYMYTRSISYESRPCIMITPPLYSGYLTSADTPASCEWTPVAGILFHLLDYSACGRILLAIYFAPITICRSRFVPLNLNKLSPPRNALHSSQAPMRLSYFASFTLLLKWLARLCNAIICFFFRSFTGGFKIAFPKAPGYLTCLLFIQYRARLLILIIIYENEFF